MLNDSMDIRAFAFPPHQAEKPASQIVEPQNSLCMLNTAWWFCWTMPKNPRGIPTSTKAC